MHNLTGISKIFKYQDFTDSVPEPTEGRDDAASGPFLTFSDDDFNRKGPVSAEATEMSVEEPVITLTPAERRLAEAEEEAEAVLEKARVEAEKIKADARHDAEEIRRAEEERGFREGHEKGLLEGQREGEEHLLAVMDEKYGGFFSAVEDACESIDVQKQEILKQHMKNLSDLSLAIAEKVVHVALESCGEVIKRMILSAAGPAIDKQWAKVMISGQDAERMREDGIQIKKLLSGISNRVELVVVDDAAPGTCLVEFPDQVIDAGAGTQIRNIREMLRNAERD